ncbi:MAG: GerMN domain-containing protein [Anaerolineae bacterium]|nr:GerMN domain-containing protein [Anaerolineae bacterium]
MDAAEHFPATNRRLWPVLVIGVMVLIGLLARLYTADSSAMRDALSGLLPWLRGTPVTLYFDAGDGLLLPVSRNLDGEADSLRGLVEALIAGPDSSSGLLGSVPANTQILDLTTEDGTARLNLSAAFLRGDTAAATQALTWSLLTLPDIHQVEIQVEDQPLENVDSHIKPLFFLRDTVLVALPTPLEDTQAALTAYLNPPPDSGLQGLPADVRLLDSTFNPANGLLRLEFTYTLSLREFAIDNPDAMRQVLTGLIATMTSFPEVKAVTLDFEGHSQLGLGQCANLLRAPQTRPTVLNDARLLGG